MNELHSGHIPKMIEEMKELCGEGVFEFSIEETRYRLFVSNGILYLHFPHSSDMHCVFPLIVERFMSENIVFYYNTAIKYMLESKKK